MKVVVTGASGLLGRAVCARLKADGHTVLGTALSRATPDSGLTKVDLTDFDALQAFLSQHAPDVIIHTAAERRPDVVERSPDASRLLNVDVPSRIAAWCKAQPVRSPLLINISTDYVFDGVSPPFTVDDAPNPLNAYGRSKWEGEKGVLENGMSGRISNLRVPVLYGVTTTNDESAVNVLLDALTVGSNTKPKKMDANAVRYPTNVDDIAKVLSQLCSKFAASDEAADTIPPTLHFSAREAMTKYDMCMVMARCLRSAGEQAETEHLVPEYEVDPNAATSRPRHCKLDLSVIQGIDGMDTDCISFESWWKEYLEKYAATAREQRAKEAAQAMARQKAEEEERLKREEEERRRREEEERVRQAEEAERKKEVERKRKEEEEERKKREEKLEKERLQLEEARQRQQLEEEQRIAEEQLKRDNEAATMQAQAQRHSDEDVQQDGMDESRGVEEASYHDREVTEQKMEDSGREEEDQTVDSSVTPLNAPAVARSSSSAGQTSLRSPSSPNPSFSSLRARPTPPATSGRSSPSPSMLSAGGGGSSSVPIPSVRQDNGDENPGKGGVGSTSTSFTETDGAQKTPSAPFDPLNPASTAIGTHDSRVDERHAQATGTEHEEGGFPTRLVRTGDGSSLGIETVADVAHLDARMDTGGQSADSDGYGLPSPRDDSQGGSTQSHPVPFAAGYGEVRYGLDASTTLNGHEQGTEPPHTSPAPLAQHRQNVLSENTTNDDKNARRIFAFQIRVGDPQKVGDPVTAHIVYTVRIKTDSPHFRSSQFSVLRRYSDFRWLHAALVHNNPGIFVPPVPEKVKLGRFAPDLVEARRHGLESCINKIANNPVLQFDDDFKLFLESQSFHADVKARDQIKGPVPTPEQKTYFGWSSTFTGTTYRYHEADEWFDEQKVYLDHLELQLKTLVRFVSALAQQRKDVAAATSETSHALMMLSGSSLSRALSTCFAGLGEVERRTFELADMQADADVREFGSVLYEYERMVGSARKAFATRIDAWQTWQRLEDELKKVQTKHDKVKRDMQPGSHRAHDGGRLQAALDELAAAETKCLNAKREFDVIGRRCKEQMDAFEWDRIRAFHEACEVWLQGMIERNQEIMSEWEQYAALLERQTGHSIQDEH